ncbi:MAG: CvpA family protein [Spirochaetales bacterium]|nr:CvpA family protein [Spirochaetales bacterium]
MNLEIPALDIVFLIIILIAVIRAVFRGFVKEIMAVSSIFLGVLLAFLFSGVVSQLLVPYMGDTVWNQVIAFLGIFVLVYLVVKLFEAGLNSLIEKINLENLDKALGFFLGLVEGILIVFVVLFGLQVQPFFDLEALLGTSYSYRFLSPFFPYAIQVLGG